ncbi:MAG TPA: hypothetical protein VKZ67_11485 [Natronosporangium sp.]|nr:hypothetical protein [Natronosporangium sp.]
MTAEMSSSNGLTETAPDPDLVAGSKILEEAARAAAVPVQRLSDTLLRCGETAGIIFYGLTGQTCGRSAEMLCSNDAWLRAHLADQGLPVVACQLRDVAAGDTAGAAAAALGFPLRLRPALADQPVYEVAGPEELPQAWRAVADGLPPRAQLLLEQAPVAQELHLAVVAGRVVAGTPDSAPSAEVADLALRAVELLPGAQYASVEFRVTEAGAWIYRVDPLLRRWARHPEPAARIAAAILATELGQPPE